MLLSPIISWVLMPLLSRAAKRSQEEVFRLLRRAIEGLLVASIPVTMIIALGADVWIRLVFGEEFAPAGMSLRVLAPIFVLTYVAILLASTLVILERSWTLTITSIAGLAALPVFIWILVPRTRGFGLGGAGTGAALGQIMMEALVVTVFLISIGRRAFDRRSAIVIGKSIAVCFAVVMLHPMLKPLGSLRLPADGAIYAILAIAVGAVRFRELAAGLRAMLMERRAAKNESAA